MPAINLETAKTNINTRRRNHEREISENTITLARSAARFTFHGKSVILADIFQNHRTDVGGLSGRGHPNAVFLWCCDIPDHRDFQREG